MVITHVFNLHLIDYNSLSLYNETTIQVVYVFFITNSNWSRRSTHSFLLRISIHISLTLQSMVQSQQLPSTGQFEEMQVRTSVWQVQSEGLFHSHYSRATMKFKHQLTLCGMI